VTPEHRLRTELEHSHAFNRAVLESFDPIRVVDAELWRVVSMDAAAESHFAADRADAPVFSCRQVGRPDESCADPECPLHRALRDGKPASVERYDEGRDRWLSVTGYPFAVGDRRFIAEVFRDVTRAKKLEQMLSYAQKMEVMGSFARNVTKTFDAVLGDILGFTSMAKLKLEKNDQLVRAVESVERSAQEAARLNMELRELAETRREGAAILKLTEIVDAILPLAGRTFPRSLLIEKELPPGIWPIIGDRDKIEHLILNLCLYFRDRWTALTPAERTGTLRIAAQNTPGEILPGGRTTGRHVTLTIGCTDVPLDQDVFSANSGLFPAADGERESTGLLPVLVSIVLEHGGRIEVSPAREGGQMAMIAFPAGGGETEFAEPGEKKNLA
jgi:nitrogen-specific signal transduction histidine kinase